MKKIFIIVATLAFLSSCSNEDTPSVAQQKVPLNVTSASILSLISTKGDFIDNDTVAVVVKGANGEYNSAKPYVYRFGRFTGPGNTYNESNPQIWTPSTLANVAYITGTNESVAAFLPVNYGSRDGNKDGIANYDAELYHEDLGYNFPSSKDFCLAEKATVSVVNPNVSFTLKHMNGVIDFRFKKASNFVVSPGNIAKIKLTGKNVVDSKDFNYKTLQWVDGATSPSYEGFFDVSIGTFSINTPNFADNTVTRIPVLVPPCEFDVSTHYIFSFTIDSKVYNVELPTSMMTKIESNHKYIIEVEFDGADVTITSVTVTDWGTTNVTNGTPLIPDPVPQVD